MKEAHAAINHGSPKHVKVAKAAWTETLRERERAQQEADKAAKKARLEALKAAKVAAAQQAAVAGDLASQGARLTALPCAAWPVHVHAAPSSRSPTAHAGPAGSSSSSLGAATAAVTELSEEDCAFLHDWVAARFTNVLSAIAAQKAAERITKRAFWNVLAEHELESMRKTYRVRAPHRRRSRGSLEGDSRSAAASRPPRDGAGADAARPPRRRLPGFCSLARVRASPPLAAAACKACVALACSRRRATRRASSAASPTGRARCGAEEMRRAASGRAARSRCSRGCGRAAVCVLSSRGGSERWRWRDTGRA